MYKKYGETKTLQGAVNWREDKTIHSFGTSIDLKNKLNRYCKKKKITKSELIREALESLLSKEEGNNMKKTTNTTFDWKGLVATLSELNVEISAKRLSAFIEAKGITVSSRSIGAVRAHLARS